MVNVMRIAITMTLTVTGAYIAPSMRREAAQGIYPYKGPTMYVIPKKARRW